MKLALPSLVAASIFISSLPATSQDAGRQQFLKQNWLGIQISDRSRFDGKRLFLLDVKPETILFADRPARIARTIKTKRFVAFWSGKSGSRFSSNPPNAGLTILSKGSTVTSTAELSRPQLHGSTLSYEVRVTSGSLPPVGEQTSVFIDDFDNVCFSCT